MSCRESATAHEKADAVIKLTSESMASCITKNAWTHEGQVIRHYGKCGDTGQTEETALPDALDEDVAVERALEQARRDGFAEIDEGDHAYLLVEYAVEGFGTPQDLDKRHALESRLSGVLGWAGVGHVDGGSIGSGTMEACCVVVDARIARKVIEQDLAGTEFADYSRIYEE